MKRLHYDAVYVSNIEADIDLLKPMNGIMTETHFVLLGS
jgi:hypothetical protein